MTTTDLALLQGEHDQLRAAIRRADSVTEALAGVDQRLLITNSTHHQITKYKDL